MDDEKLGEIAEELDASTRDAGLWTGAAVRDGIGEGSALAERALSSRWIGPYTLQAAIAAVHAKAGRADATDWGALPMNERSTSRGRSRSGISSNDVWTSWGEDILAEPAARR